MPNFASANKSRTFDYFQSPHESSHDLHDYPQDPRGRSHDLYRSRDRFREAESLPELFLTVYDLHLLEEDQLEWLQKI